MRGERCASRRAAIQALACAVSAVAAGALLAACASKEIVAPASAPLPSRTPSGDVSADGSDADVIMLIRHAEKPTGLGSARGITADGTESAGSLTVAGWIRAGALVALFAPARGAPPVGLRTPTDIWAADPRGVDGQRPQQTVTPLAARLALTVNTRFEKGDEAGLAAELINRHGVSLVAWQHQNILAIAAHLGAVTPAPPQFWRNERYDVVWVFTRTAAGWAFSQVPQLALAADRADVIV